MLNMKYIIVFLRLFVSNTSSKYLMNIKTKTTFITRSSESTYGLKVFLNFRKFSSVSHTHFTAQQILSLNSEYH